MQPIDILTMVDPEQQKRRELLNKTCRYMQLATNEGKTKKEIETTLKGLELPIDIHLTVFGRFTEICKHGRVLTKTERIILS